MFPGKETGLSGRLDVGGEGKCRTTFGETSLSEEEEEVGCDQGHITELSLASCQ
jgi:hypothetical protein